MTEDKHWSSRVEFVEAKFLRELIPKINEFCKGKFVVGIQYPDAFQEGGVVAIISYKVKE